MKIIENIKSNIFIQNQIVFCEDHNWIFMKINKNAGTSMYRKVIELQIPNTFFKKRNIDIFNKWLNSLTDEEFLNNYFKFSFVRNPFDRLVSAYGHIIQSRWKENWSFERFVEHHMVDKDGQALNDHWAPQHLCTHYNGKCYVDYIGRFENIDKDWQYVADKLKVNRSLPHYNHFTKRKSNYKEYYTDPKIKDMVAEFYKEDLKLFNYEFE